jgi:MFS family permease
VATPNTISAPPPTGAIPILTKRPPWSETFISLAVPNYRLYASGQIIATTAMGMQRVAQDWLVLQLSGSVTAVGITVAMQFAPMLIFGLLGGVIADRYSKRMLLMITQSTAALIAATLAVLILTGTVEVWMIWALAFVGGLVTVVDNPARQVFVNEIVGPNLLRNAISLNSSTFQLGGLIGPAVGGILITAVGSGWSFLINMIACLTVVTALGLMKKSELNPSPIRPRNKGQLAEGLRYSRSKPAIFWTILIVGFVAVFAYNMPVLLSDYADKVFKVGAAGYGIFNAIVAFGALAGAIMSTRRLSVGLRTTILTALALGGIQAAAGFAPSIAPFVVLICATGVASLLFLTAANSLIQMSTNLGIRGRVMALYMLVLLGGQAIGGPVMGWIVQTFGAHVAMILSGGVPLLAAVAISLLLARQRKLGVTVGLSGYRPRVAIEHRKSHGRVLGGIRTRPATKVGARVQ